MLLLQEVSVLLLHQLGNLVQMRVDVFDLELGIGHYHKVLNHLGKVVFAEAKVALCELLTQLKDELGLGLEVEAE